jgi:hypothetical protein
MRRLLVTRLRAEPPADGIPHVDPVLRGIVRAGVGATERPLVVNRVLGEGTRARGGEPEGALVVDAHAVHDQRLLQISYPKRDGHRRRRPAVRRMSAGVEENLAARLGRQEIGFREQAGRCRVASVLGLEQWRRLLVGKHELARWFHIESRLYGYEPVVRALFVACPVPLDRIRRSIVDRPHPRDHRFWSLVPRVVNDHFEECLHAEHVFSYRGSSHG